MASQKVLQKYLSNVMKTIKTKTHEIDSWEQRLQVLQRTRTDLEHVPLNMGQEVISIADLEAYYAHYAIIQRQITSLQKEELLILQRIEKYREEIISLRQSLKQVERLMARRKARQIDRQNRLQAEGNLALGLSHKLISREDSLLRVPFGVTSIRISRRAARKIGQHARH
ncbi:flagellar FliJ family protein [Sulfobacillus thermosulfidooxidans]|uniref:flagellar FliJ family protein n=1 Tax=Sulfobacillus thermosulfidooxidans TaxID=28034 RepID=UPI000AD2EC91|nr:flagellar FliJ family protein [Sulfobacillus thermosulfidooxidans]